MGEAQPGAQAAVAGRGGLFGDQPGQELGVAEALGAGLVQERGQDLGGAGELQVAEVLLELLVQTGRGGLGGHLDAPPSKS